MVRPRSPPVPKASVAVETVVQLRPLAGFDQFRDGLRDDRRARALERTPDVGTTGLEQHAGRYRVLDLPHFVHCATFPASPYLCKLLRS